MAEDTSIAEDQANPARESPAGTMPLSLGDASQNNGPQPVVEDIPPAEPLLSLTGDRDDDKAGKPPRALEELEARIRRLEEQYAVLQDPKQMEERVVQRITTRLRRKPVTQIRESPASLDDLPVPSLVKMDDPSPSLAEPDLVAPSAARSRPRLELDSDVAPPAGRDPRPVPTAIVAPASGNEIAPMATVVPSSWNPPLASAAPVPPQPESTPRSRVSWLWRSWFVLDILNELRVMLRMFVDPRYRLTWPGRVVPLAIMVIIVLSELESLAILFPWNLVPFIGKHVLNKLVQILLTFVMFKVLLREVDRYREQIPDAPRPMRPS